MKLLMSALLAVLTVCTMGRTAHAAVPVFQNHENMSKACEEKSLRQDLDWLTAPIAKQSDLKSFLKSGGRLGELLSRLQPTSKKRFIDSLRFGDAGLASFYFQDIEEELSVSEIYQLLSLFGLQSGVSKFSNAPVRNSLDREIRDYFSPSGEKAVCEDGMYRNMECARRGTCGYYLYYYCTSNC